MDKPHFFDESLVVFGQLYNDILISLEANGFVENQRERKDRSMIVARGNLILRQQYGVRL